jgi:hypothetical protein
MEVAKLLVGTWQKFGVEHKIKFEELIAYSSTSWLCYGKGVYHKHFIDFEVKLKTIPWKKTYRSNLVL